MILSKVYDWRVIALTMILCLEIYSNMAYSHDFKRFLFANKPSCKLCYDCICLSKWGECLANDTHHQFVEDGCQRFRNHNLNCSAPCHQHGVWGQWSSWDVCQGDCGHASRFRTRSCSNPRPANCGSACSGEHAEIAVCTPDACRATYHTTARVTATSKATADLDKLSTSLTTKSTHVAACDHACAVIAVGLNYTLTAMEASLCADGRRAGSDALPIRCCHLAADATWRKGENVLINCPHLPIYSPVAIFDGDHYLMETAGIFVGCLHNGETGFKLIRQTCDISPELIHVSLNSDDFTSDALKYYIVV